MAVIAQPPSILRQLELIRLYCSSAKILKDEKSLDCSVYEWLASVEFTETRKKDAFFLRFAFAPHGAPRNCWQMMTLYFTATWGELLERTAPRGPLFHLGKKTKK